jgi:hypothetical protein
VWSHMLVCHVFGVKPWGHHLINVLLHALNVALVFAWLRQMTGATWRSLLVAALFAVHPLRVEAVAWVTERREVLSGCFGLLALMAYVRYAQKAVISNQWSVISGQLPRAATRDNEPQTTGYRLLITDHPSSVAALRRVDRLLFYFLSLFFLALGLMSKPTLVTWPFVMLLLDYWPLGRMQNAEGRMQNSEASDTSTLRSTATEDGCYGGRAPRNPHHASRFTIHDSRFTHHSPAPGRGKDPVLCPRGSRERCALGGAGAWRRFGGG